MSEALRSPLVSMNAIMSEPRINSSKPRFPVLVVDDSPFARKLIEHSLPGEHYEVAYAATGEEALAMICDFRPGVVITDWLMPDLSGIKLCERIRSDHQDRFIYVILLTSVSEKAQVVKGLKAGADDYLTKPFHADELLARTEVGKRFVELHREIEAKNRLLEQLALTDELTLLPNRRAVEHWAQRQLNGAARHDFPFCVIACDLDQFKTVNDTHGHEAGDLVLKKFAEILKTNTRQSDICGRIGGDEFLIVLTYTKEDGTRAVIERIRQQFQAHRFEFGGQDVSVTASFGVARFQRGQSTEFERLLVQADVALYQAKRQGKNRVRTAGVEVPAQETENSRQVSG
jgi:diguanylate cyclase (GGDEF)-like protein